MGSYRVRGIVSLANLVRRQLAGPISPAALERLRQHVAEGLEQIDLMLSDEGLAAADLTAASRKAYDFLKGLDLSTVPMAGESAGQEHLRGTMRLSGLRSFVQALAAGLAGGGDAAALDRAGQAIRRRLAAIDEAMAQEAVGVEHLRDDSQALRAWLVYFSRRENLDCYAEAVGRAVAAFGRELASSRRYQAPARVCFLPMKGLYRLRPAAAGTRVILPTPMITFPDRAFALLAEAALRKARHDQAIMDLMLGPAYQDALAELEELAGGGDRPAGVHHDLAGAFRRVSAGYFGSAISRPHLVWGRALTMRKFGHYDRVHDTVLVSASLDSPGVPEAAVDFVVYHELLHRQLGVGWDGGRRSAHTAEFRRRERLFRRFAEAQAVLGRLSKEV